MEPWQTRVIAEKVELDERIERLQAALMNPAVFRFELDQLDLMSRQLGYMRAYSACLRDRIESWRQ